MWSPGWPGREGCSRGLSWSAPYRQAVDSALEPIIYIGKNGLTDGAIQGVITALSSRELIKIKFREFKDEKQEIAEKIAIETLSLIVGIIGHTLILFKQNHKPEKQEYRLP